MTELLARVRGYFVEVDEATVATPRSRHGSSAPSSLGFVAPASLATATGAALALVLARAHGCPCALLCHWGPAPGGAPATRSAARAAAAMRTRDLVATAAGRVVRVALDDEPHTSTALARAAAVVAGPSVLAVGRPRNKDVDRALAEQDAIGWLPPHDAAESLLAAVAESLEALGRPVVRCRAPSALARRLALAGILVPTVVGADLIGAAT